MRMAYYMFLGRGDYLPRSMPLDAIDPKWRRPAEISPLASDWTFSWPLTTWCRHLDQLRGLGADRLYLFLNAFELPYPSRRFPELVESDHANVLREFLPELLVYARRIGLDVVAGMSTTGHCDRALQLHPEWAGVHADGTRWQCAMCHNNPLAREFVQDLVEEVLDRYPGFTGVFLHPPEVGEYCHCPHCQSLYQQETGRALKDLDETARMSWFWITAARFMAALFNQVHSHAAGLNLFTCSIPGVWRRHFPVIGPLLPKSVGIMHWCYGRLTEKQRDQMAADLRAFAAYGHAVSFANSLIFASSTMTDGELRENNLANNQVARAAGVKEIVYFLGPVWQEHRIFAGSAPP